MNEAQPTLQSLIEEVAALSLKNAALRAELKQVRRERDALFCDKHRPNASKKYVGCLVCSRNEDYLLVCDFLSALGWTHDKESGLWARDSEEGAVFNTSDAVVKAIEDHDGLRAAHKKACLYSVSQYKRAEVAEQSRERMREALEPLADIEPDCMYIEARVGSENHRGRCVRMIVDRRGLASRTIEWPEDRSTYLNEDAAEWLREIIRKARKALEEER